MDRLLEFLTNFYWPLLPQVLVESLWHADWSYAYQRHGLAGLAAQFLHSIAGTNSYPFLVPMRCGWSGQQIQQLLASKGIRMWGWSFSDGIFLFHVRKKQAAWAQYAMRRAGISLQGPLLDESEIERNPADSGNAVPHKARQDTFRESVALWLDRWDGWIEGLFSVF